MSKYQVYHSQSLFDIAIELTGDPANAFWIAKHNDLVLSEPLSSTAVIEIPEGMVLKREIKEHYQINELKPATGLTKADSKAITGCEGISCWAIGIDFKVS